MKGITPPRGVGIIELVPYPYAVLWSTEMTAAMVKSFRRNNPSYGPPEPPPPGHRFHGRTYTLGGISWILFNGTPTIGTVTHECCHAIGDAFRYMGAEDEVQLGGEIEAYLLGDLVGRIARAVKARPGP